MTASSARNIILVAAVIVLGALYYISRRTQHRWMTARRGGPAKRILHPDESGA